MDRPSCDICGAETQWYGWLHGWLCPVCIPEELAESEDEAVDQRLVKDHERSQPILHLEV
ncbi:MAG TPA: hypothetical protein V6D14_21005 [Coleofasciculaceae cyanobacterium]|jgi:hypothetical protein